MILWSVPLILPPRVWGFQVLDRPLDSRQGHTHFRKLEEIGNSG